MAESTYMVCERCEKRIPRTAVATGIMFGSDPLVSTPGDFMERFARSVGKDQARDVACHKIHQYGDGGYSTMVNCGPLREPTAGDEYLVTLEAAFGPLVP